MQHRLYVGTIGEGLFRSTDSGESFMRTCEGMFVECHVRALAVHPHDPHVIYLGSEQGLFRSTDGAEQWNRIDSPLNGRQIWSILLSPHNPDTIVVGTCPARLFRSEDGGRSWTEPRVEMAQECPRIMHTRITTILVDPSDAETLWAGVEIDGVRRSRDGGRSWHEIGSGISSRDLHGLALVARPGQAPQLVATTNNDINLSADGGETWQPLAAAKMLPLPYFRGLAQPCGQADVLLVGNGDRPPGSTGLIARSSNGGKSWTPARMPGRANSTIWNFAVHPADPRLIYSSSVSGQVYRSRDGGESWEKLEREFGEIRALAWTP